MKNKAKNKFNSYLFLIFLIVCAFNVDAQNRISVHGELERLTYPVETPGWIDFKPGNNLNPETFFQEYKEDLNLTNDDKLILSKRESDNLGYTHYLYFQYYKNIKVIGAEIGVHHNGTYLKSINGQIVSGLSVDINPLINEDEALKIVFDKYNPATKFLWQNDFYEKEIKTRLKDPDATYYPKAELCIAIASGVSDFKASNFHLSWKIDIMTVEQYNSFAFYIDASSGKIINKTPLVFNCSTTPALTTWNGSRNISTFFVPTYGYKLLDDCPSHLPVQFRCMNYNGGSPIEIYNASNVWTNLTDVQSFWGLIQSYGYFKSTFGRNSWDNNYSDCIILQDFSLMDNAYGGNGSIRIGQDSTSTASDDVNCIDIVGHEFTHSVTGASAGLIYNNESGALNESFSDIFGELVQNYATGSLDWLIGAERGTPFRSFINPNAYGDPDTYLGVNWCNYNDTSLWCTKNDDGGVHTNSGVQNFFFYLLVNGGTGTNDNAKSYSVSGIGLNDAGAIAYKALNTVGYLTSSSQYIDARAAWLHAANDLFGNCSNQSIEVANAWYAVGVGVQSPANNATICGALNGNYYGINSVENNCSSAVSSGVTVNMSALTLVKLNPPFYANNGSTFRAYLGEPCALTSYRPLNISSGTDDQNNPYLSLKKRVNKILIIPNPVSYQAKITFDLINNNAIEIKIFNSQMQLVKTLVPGLYMQKGEHTIELYASDIPAGVYICRLQAGDKLETAKVVITK